MRAEFLDCVGAAKHDRDFADILDERDNCRFTIIPGQAGTDADGADDDCDCALDDSLRYPGAAESKAGFNQSYPGDTGFDSFLSLARQEHLPVYPAPLLVLFRTGETRI